MIDPAAITLADLEADPHPILAELRERAPATYVPSIDMWLVNRWDDVVYVCENPDLFTANTDPSWLRQCLGENMLTLDGYRHDRLANGMRPPFAGTPTGRAMAQRLPAMLDEVIDGFAASKSADLMPLYAEPLANLTLLEALGFDTVTWQQLAEWCHGVITGLANFENEPEKAAIAARAHGALGDALGAHLRGIDEREASSGLASYVGAGFTREEITNNVRLMVSGGINEPRDAVGLVMYEILKDPHLHRRVMDDRSVIRKVVEETFRFHSPVGTATRQTTRDVTLDGVTIPEGRWWPRSSPGPTAIHAGGRIPTRFASIVARGRISPSVSASTDVWGSGWGVSKSGSESTVSSTGCPGFVSTGRSTSTGSSFAVRSRCPSAGTSSTRDTRPAPSLWSM